MVDFRGALCDAMRTLYQKPAMSFERDPTKLYPHDHLMRLIILPLIPSFVTPNAVTIFRIIGTPFVLYFLLTQNYRVAMPLFLFFAFTDALDGSLARVRKQITKWGTFYDPVADKLLIGSVVLIVVYQHIHPLFALVIVALEGVIIAGGHKMRSEGRVVSANVFGKTKMFLQVLGVTFLFIAIWAGIDLFVPISVGTLSLAIAFAILSLYTYGI